MNLKDLKKIDEFQTEYDLLQEKHDSRYYIQCNVEWKREVWQRSEGKNRNEIERFEENCWIAKWILFIAREAHSSKYYIQCKVKWNWEVWQRREGKNGNEIERLKENCWIAERIWFIASEAHSSKYYIQCNV